MKTSSAKAKGQDLQKAVVEMLGEISGLSTGKDCDIATRPSSQTGIDIALSPRAKEILPISWECKKWKKIAYHSAIRQAIKNRQPGTIWAACLEQKGQGVKKKFNPIVVIEEADFSYFFHCLLIKNNKFPIRPELIENHLPVKKVPIDWYSIRSTQIQLYESLQKAKDSADRNTIPMISFTRLATKLTPEQSTKIIMDINDFMYMLQKLLEIYGKIPIRHLLREEN